MKRFLLLGFFISAVAPAIAFAQTDLAKAKNCMVCHAVANKVMGPSFKDVATKYKDQKDAEAILMQKVMKGSAGAWGPIPMPPNPQVSETEARSLAKWVMLQK